MDAAKLALDPSYVLRFKARMQERIAEAREADGKDASDLRTQASELRVKASAPWPASGAADPAATQKIKLLHFLRQQK